MVSFMVKVRSRLERYYFKEYCTAQSADKPGLCRFFRSYDVGQAKRRYMFAKLGSKKIVILESLLASLVF